MPVRVNQLYESGLQWCCVECNKSDMKNSESHVFGNKMTADNSKTEVALFSVVPLNVFSVGFVRFIVGWHVW